MSKKQTPHRHEIEITDEQGNTHRGTYVIESGCVTVSYPPWGTKATQIGNSPAERIARLLLGELIIERRRQEGRSHS